MLKKLGFGKSDKESSSKEKSTSPAATSASAQPAQKPVVSSENGQAGHNSSVISSSAVAVKKPLPPPPAQHKPAAAFPVSSLPETSRSLEEQLLDATIAGDWRTATLLIQRGANVGCKNFDGSSLFMMAAAANSVDLLKIYLPHVRKGSMADTDGKLNVLDSALACNAIDALRWLVENGYDVNTIHDFVLECAANLGHSDVLEYLRGKITNPGVKVPSARKLMPYAVELYNAALSGNNAEIENCIRLGADINRTVYGPNPAPALHHAATSDKFETAQWLIKEKGCDPNVSNADNENILWTAAQRGNLALLRWCKQYPQIDPNQCNKYGVSAVAMAGRNGHLDAVKCLVEEFRVKLDPPFISSEDGKIIMQAGHTNILVYLRDQMRAIKAARESAAASSATISAAQSSNSGLTNGAGYQYQSPFAARTQTPAAGHTSGSSSSPSLTKVQA